ncbi:MAG TPA: 50S ribosomal protein L3 N(5)-glutamine methyltransferase [Burkholderiales bacterium]|nr:50S ribosomal protein L3 N(5)-glutamine methyltransferase [Burkholderiales bacterium]
MTLGDLIEAAERRLRRARLHYGHGTDNPRDEAAYLVLRGLGLPFEAPLERQVGADRQKRVESLIRKRIHDRIPVAYLLHEAWLAGVAFYVDRRVIVPRSHIAELLGDRLRSWLQRPPRRVLDLCTGSGCLAILAARAFPRARVDATDISPAALAVARRNIFKHRLGRRIRVLRSDLFAALDGERYDLILTNPPYVTAPSMKRLPPEYRYEPRAALAGGRDGLDFVSRILAAAPAHLNSGGLLVCEVGANRQATEKIHPGVALLWPKNEVFMLQVSRTAGASRRRPTRGPARR